MRWLAALLLGLACSGAAADIKTADALLDAIHRGDHAALGVKPAQIAGLKQQLGATRAIDELRAGERGERFGRLRPVGKRLLVIRLLPAGKKGWRFGGLQQIEPATYNKMKLLERPRPQPAWGDRKKIATLDRRDPVNTAHHVLRAIDRIDTEAVKALWSRAADRRFDLGPVVARARIVEWLTGMKRQVGTLRFVVELRATGPIEQRGVLALVRTEKREAIVLRLVLERQGWCFDELQRVELVRYRQASSVWIEAKRK